LGINQKRGLRQTYRLAKGKKSSPARGRGFLNGFLKMHKREGGHPLTQGTTIKKASASKKSRFFLGERAGIRGEGGSRLQERGGLNSQKAKVWISGCCGKKKGGGPGAWGVRRVEYHGKESV